MAWFDKEQGKMVRFSPRRVPNYPGWRLVDCGCCGGLRWGGESPEECNDCHGSGANYWHVKSGVLAAYPGGPFMGRIEKKSEEAL